MSSLSLPRLLVCALLALAMLPAAAQADIDLPQLPVPATDVLMGTAHGLAVSRWGVEACGGQVGVTWAHMGAGINARSQWMSTDVHNPATYSQCSITYNLDVDWDWPKLCTVVEHELGHLSGHEHVNDPHNVMSPYYVYPSSECAGRRQPRRPPRPGHHGRGPRRRAGRAQGDEEEGRQAQGHQAQGEGHDARRQGQGPLGPQRAGQEVELAPRPCARRRLRRRQPRRPHAVRGGRPRLLAGCFSPASASPAPTGPRRGRPRACPRASAPAACRAGTTRRRARPCSREPAAVTAWR